MEKHWKRRHTTTLAAVTVGIVVANLVIPVRHRVWAWLLTMALLILFIAVAGHGLTGLWRGALIDYRNFISLSRFQMMLWTVLILAGFLTLALYNVDAGSTAPLSIAIPEELWALMGISTASLVGSPLVKSTKEGQTPDPKEKNSNLQLLAERFGYEKKELDSRGLIVVNKDPHLASWANLFMAEQTRNAGRLDLAKIQMFFFTIVLSIAYAFALGSLMTSEGSVVSSFPDLDAGALALIGISHAGYLTNKAIPHS